MHVISNLLGKLSIFLIQTILKRNASTWPGHIALKVNPQFIERIIKKNPHLKIVLIAGTNGKTTTTKALDHILMKNQISTVRNTSGANLQNGLASLLIKYSNTLGRINKEVLLFEVDENALPSILRQLTELDSRLSIVLLNLFRDQLDRYGEVNTIAEKWKDSLKKISNNTKIIANADDALIAFIAQSAKGEKKFFSIPNDLKRNKTLVHAVDSINCPNCSHTLSFKKISYSHIGNYSCPNCGFKNPKAHTYDIATQLKGVFSIYNLSASIAVAVNIFDIDEKKALSDITNFRPAFGRQEEIKINNKTAIILLSKNPTGFNESLKVVLENKYQYVFLLLNDRIPDGRDISWIWDVDFELLASKKLHIFVSGDRKYDLANRLKYAGISNITTGNLKELLKKAIKKTPPGQTLAILPTYSAMLEIRKLLTGKSIL